MKSNTEPATGLALLRVPFPQNQISKLPKPLVPNEEWKKLPKAKCNECGGYHATSKTIHLDYVGHAALTDRLLDADPNWTWEPVSMGDDGQPKLDSNGGMWIKLTVCGVTRLGYGDAQGKTGGNAVKERIGDALRNAAMRFGAALDLWHKGELHMDEDDAQALAERKEKGLPTETINPTSGAKERMSEPQRLKVDAVASEVIDCFEAGAVESALDVIEAANLDADEKVYMWTFLDSKQRASLKRIAKERHDAKLKELAPSQA